MSFEAELALARKAALAAGEYLRGLKGREVVSLQGRDIKLKADKESETILLDILSKIGLPVLSEESPPVEDEEDWEGLRWIIDPLDGSYNYFKGLADLCCVSVALWDGDRPVLGVVNKFMAGELYEGRPGDGAYLNGRRVTASNVTDPAQAVCGTGFSVKGDFSGENLTRCIRIFQRFKKIRMLGAAALMSAYVGVGILDAYFEKDILLWDIAAGAAVVAAGGGVVECKLKAERKCDIFCFANQKLKANYERLDQ